MTAVLTAPPLTTTRRLTLPTWATPVAIFLATRVATTALLAIGASTRQAARAAQGVSPQSWWEAFSQLVLAWDSQWFSSIATGGYASQVVDAAGEPIRTNLAFYPAYPTLAKAVMTVTGLPFGLVGPLLSIALGAAAAALIVRLLEERVGRTRALWLVAVLGTSAGAVALQMGYAEGLALFLVAATLLLLRQHRYGWAVGAVVALGLTRNIGLAMAPVVALHWLLAWRDARSGGAPVAHVRLGVLVVASLGGGALWPLLAGLRSGRADGYLTTMSAWYYPPNPISTSTVGVVFSLGLPGFLMLLVAAACLGRLLVTRTATWGPELAGWTVSYVCYLLLLTPPSLSAARYALLAFPLFLLLVPSSVRTGSLPARTLAIGSIALGLVLQYLWIGLVLVYWALPQAYAVP